MDNLKFDIQFLRLKLGIRKAMLGIPTRRAGRATIYNRFSLWASKELFDAVVADWISEGVITTEESNLGGRGVGPKTILVWHEEAIK